MNAPAYNPKGKADDFFGQAIFFRDMKKFDNEQFDKLNFDSER
jgi:hypothetical protein